MPVHTFDWLEVAAIEAKCLRETASDMERQASLYDQWSHDHQDARTRDAYLAYAACWRSAATQLRGRATLRARQVAVGYPSLDDAPTNPRAAPDSPKTIQLDDPTLVD